jgi:hypothetical protein
MARALERPRDIDAAPQMLLKLIASPAWPKFRLVPMWILASVASCALLLVLLGDYGYSRWMYASEFLSLLKDHDENGTWFTAVEGRWRNGSWQMRIREEPVPKDKKFSWTWSYNITESAFFARLGELSAKGFTLVQCQFYSWPEGTKMYQAVWQKIEHPQR